MTYQEGVYLSRRVYNWCLGIESLSAATTTKKTAGVAGDWVAGDGDVLETALNLFCNCDRYVADASGLRPLILDHPAWLSIENDRHHPLRIACVAGANTYLSC